MLNWFRRKTQLDKLKERYRRLMRKSYQVALHDTEESDNINREARNLLEKIKEYKNTG